MSLTHPTHHIQSTSTVNMQNPEEDVRFNLMCLDGSKNSAHCYLDCIEQRAHAKGFPLDALEMAKHVNGPVNFKINAMTLEMFNSFIEKYRASVNKGEWLEPDDDDAFVLRDFL